MNRRALLAVVAGSVAGAAGCTSTESASVNDDPFSEYDCPPLEASDETTCSHTVDTDEEDVYLLASPETSPDPSEITITLTNDSAAAIEFNPYSWDLWVEQSGNWRRIEQQIVIDAYGEVEPDERYEWEPDDVAMGVLRDFEFEPGTYFARLAMGPDAPGCLFRVTES